MMRLILSLLVCVTLSGCLSPSEKVRVHQASEVSSKFLELYRQEKPEDEVVEEFLENNARAWGAFDKAVNGE